MGQPVRTRKTYSRPLRRYDATRIKDEGRILQLYGLKNKKEIWGAQNIIRKFRATARGIMGLADEEAAHRRQELIGKLAKIGLLGKEATLDDVLGLTVSDILNRRLQTLIFRKGMSKTVKQARQFITHGQVLVAGRRSTSPGTIITKDLEDKINVLIKIEEPAKPATAAAAEVAK